MIDEFKHTYDFTEKAIGKTFKIITRPADGIEPDMIDDVTSELVVNIVDGYNVTTAKELNVISNGEDDIDDNDTRLHIPDKPGDEGHHRVLKNAIPGAHTSPIDIA